MENSCSTFTTECCVKLGLMNPASQSRKPDSLASSFPLTSSRHREEVSESGLRVGVQLHVNYLQVHAQDGLCTAGDLYEGFCKGRNNHYPFMGAAAARSTLTLHHFSPSCMSHHVWPRCCAKEHVYMKVGGAHKHLVWYLPSQREEATFVMDWKKLRLEVSCPDS